MNMYVKRNRCCQYFLCLSMGMTSNAYSEACTAEDLAQRKASLEAYLLDMTTMDADTLAQLPDFAYALECELVGANQTYDLNDDSVNLLNSLDEPSAITQLLNSQSVVLSEELSSALGDGSTQGVNVPQLQNMLETYISSSELNIETLQTEAESLGVPSDLVKNMLQNLNAHEKWEAMFPKR